MANADNNCVNILNPNLTFFSGFGKCYRGSDNGQFNQPCDVAFDSTGKVYVTDLHNHRIQVFTEFAGYLRQFGREGSGKGELKRPRCICFDNHDVLYVTVQM